MSSKTYEPNYREKIVVWVWERMAVAYPERWLRVMGPAWDAKQEKLRKKKPHLWPRLGRSARIWAGQLERLDKDAVSRAVTRAETLGRLPSLPEFLALCRGGDGCIEARRPPEQSVEPARVREARRARGAQCLANLRADLA